MVSWRAVDAFVASELLYWTSNQRFSTASRQTSLACRPSPCLQRSTSELILSGFNPVKRSKSNGFCNRKRKGPASQEGMSVPENACLFVLAKIAGGRSLLNEARRMYLVRPRN